MSAVGRVPAATHSVEVGGIGKFSFDASQIGTVRPDIFQKGHFSLFDVLVHVHDVPFPT